MRRTGHSYKKGLSILLAAVLVFPLNTGSVISLAAPVAEGGEPAISGSVISKLPDDGFNITSLKEGTYVEGEVIIKYKDGALAKKSPVIKSAGRSIKAARADKHIAETFGCMEEAAGKEDEVVSTTDAQKKIISGSLGSDYTIEETVCIDADGENTFGGNLSMSAADDEEMNISLVSSDKYDTGQLITMLSGNADIEYAEPNYIICPTELDWDAPSASAMVNDEYAANTYIIDLMHADEGWKKLKELTDSKDADGEQEMVVAVLDTGLDLTHPDLQGRIWTNPGGIGLNGEHGYDFIRNSSEMIDTVGHGTHCAGIIAAAADNGTGISGVTGPADVKIMPLRVYGDSESAIITVLGAFDYVLDAKKRGVNIVATSNSWCIETGICDTQMFRDILNKLGEAGIMNFFSAGNSTKDLDASTVDPITSNTDYVTIVGSMDEYGNTSEFSNYGRCSVDLFAPGHNILSAVNDNVYFPAIYSSEKLAETTEFYGEFSTGASVTGVSANSVPGDDGMGYANTGVKAFGPSKVIIPEGSKAGCTLEIVKDKYFNASDDPASLKVSFDNVEKGEELYICFPYDKSMICNGDNTYFSIVYRSSYIEGGGTAKIRAGDVIMAPGQSPYLHDEAEGYSLDLKCNNMVSNIWGTTCPAYMIGDGASCGLGLRIQAESSGKLELYIDSIGISGQVSREEFGKYDLMSGTSMACPAVAGMYALLCAISPKEADVEDGYAFTMKEKLLSLVNRTPEFEDKCSTGGYLDFSLLNAKIPSIVKTVADPDEGTITLKGSYLNGVTKLSYTRMPQKEGASEVPVSKDEKDAMYYTLSGNDIVIHGAKELIGTYTRFTVVNENDGTKGTGTFFLVDGEKPFEELSYDVIDITTDDAYYLLTDGTTLFGVGYYSADLMVYEQNEYGYYAFKPAADHSVMDDFVYTDACAYMNVKRYDINNGDYSCKRILNPVLSRGRVLQVVRIDRGTKYRYFLAGYSLYEPDAYWSFTPMEDFPYDSYVGGRLMTYNDEVYYIGGLDEEGNAIADVYHLEPATAGEEDEGLNEGADHEGDDNDLAWKETVSMNIGVYSATGGQNGEYLYVFGGLNGQDSPSAAIQRFDGEKWETLDMKLPSDVFRFPSEDYRAVAAAPIEGGFIVTGESADGYGDTYIIDFRNSRIEPLYYTMNGGLSETAKRYCALRYDGLYVLSWDNYDTMDGIVVHRLGCGEDTFERPYADIEYHDLGAGRGSYLGSQHALKGEKTKDGIKGQKTYFYAIPDDEYSYVESVTLGDPNDEENEPVELEEVEEGSGLYGFVADCDSDTAVITIEWGKETEYVSFTRGVNCLAAGSTYQFEAQADGTDSRVTFDVSDDRYADVDPETGVVTVKEEGIGKTIEVYAVSVEKPNLRDVCKVEILPVQAVDIKFAGDNSTIKAGTELALSVLINPENVTYKDISYKSSNEAYAVVDENGVVKALTAGVGKTVYITAVTTNGMKAVLELKILAGDPAPSGSGVTPPSGGSGSGTGNVPSVNPSGSSSVSPSGSTGSTATAVTPSGSGTSHQTAKGISFKKKYKKLKIGKKIKLKVKFADSAADKSVTFKSSNKKYATVNKKGVVKAKKSGIGKTVKITAKAKDGSKAVMKIKITK